MPEFNVAIIGAAGMGGGELLRYLLQHPQMRIGQLVSRSQAGRAVVDIHPHLLPLAGRTFNAELQPDDLAGGRPAVLFSAMGHGELAGAYPALARSLDGRDVLLLDLSADFRLDSEEAWQRYYGSEHPSPQFLAEFTYGFPEMNREALAGSRRIASPGCFATAMNLALLPLAGRLSDCHIAISAATGSSGSGILPSAGTHHPHRAQDFRAYNMLKHRHQAELEMLLAAHGSKGVRISFVPHSAPIVRGIFASVIMECASDAQASEYAAVVNRFYADEAFVQVVDGSPRVAAVAGSNMAQLHASSDGRTLLVLSAIDNLGKGMAGQAIQNMNIALGLPEATGLRQPALYP